MEALKRILTQRFEVIFISLILISTALINVFVDQRLAFLAFYNLPVILAGYFLGTRLALLGAVLSGMVNATYMFLEPDHYTISYSQTDALIHVGIWTCFLVLCAAVVGRQHERIARRIVETSQLNNLLKDRTGELESLNTQVTSMNVNLEQKVQARTEELERSKAVMESLKSKVEHALYSTMDSDVVKLMIEGRLRTEKRHISVLFADLAGFTSYSEERRPELVVRDLNAFLKELEPTLFGFRAHLDKFMGDGVMCEFGAPIDYEKHALQAVLAGLSMQRRIRNMEFPCKMRVGIASGMGIVGIVGNQRQSYTAIGDVVNLSSRLEKICPVGDVLIDEQAYAAIAEFVNVHLMHDIHPGHHEVEIKDRAEVERLTKALQAVDAAPERARILFELAAVFRRLDEAELTVEYLKQASRLDPGTNDYRLALADAMLLEKASGAIAIRGKRRAVKAYVVESLKDPLADRNRFPAGMVERYGRLVDSIDVPEEFLLRVEAIDGTIRKSRVVAALSRAMAEALRLDSRECATVMRAGFLADLGKEIVPHHILNRRGTLTESEMRDVEKHPDESVRKIRAMGYDVNGIDQLIHHSHERFNGSGYPGGLAGDAIPIGSRIIAVADAFDALTATRPYRDKLDQAVAQDEIAKGAQRGLFDPQVTQALVRVLGDARLRESA